MIEKSTKKEREYKKYLMRLTNAVSSFEYQMDQTMKAPSNSERGQKIAALMNSLSIENQAAMRYGLGRSFKHINRAYENNKLEADRG